MKSQTPRPVVVSLTSIPPRFAHLPNKVNSLLNQSVKVDRIEIYIPTSYRRFPGRDFKIPPLPKGVSIVRVDQDYGPATKLLPALEKWKHQDVDILICDDDRQQDKDWVLRFVEARSQRPDDIICERGWNIGDRFGISQSSPLEPRACLNAKGGRTVAYRIQRLLSLGLYHPSRTIFDAPGYVDVFEGFLGALVPPGAMPDQAWSIPEVLWTVDDVWLSGMARLNGVGVWAHSIPRPVYSNGRWDRVEALSDYLEQGVGRESADRMCVEYLRSNYNVWI